MPDKLFLNSGDASTLPIFWIFLVFDWSFYITWPIHLTTKLWKKKNVSFMPKQKWSCINADILRNIEYIYKCSIICFIKFSENTVKFGWKRCMLKTNKCRIFKRNVHIFLNTHAIFRQMHTNVVQDLWNHLLEFMIINVQEQFATHF